VANAAALFVFLMGCLSCIAFRREAQFQVEMIDGTIKLPSIRFEICSPKKKAKKNRHLVVRAANKRLSFSQFGS
jgi:hypothetical protein